MKRICCFLTGGHRFQPGKTEIDCDDESKTCKVTETCCKCGKNLHSRRHISSLECQISNQNQDKAADGAEHSLRTHAGKEKRR